jgi:hypothetical protein
VEVGDSFVTLVTTVWDPNIQNRKFWKVLSLLYCSWRFAVEAPLSSMATGMLAQAAEILHVCGVALVV